MYPPGLSLTLDGRRVVTLGPGALLRDDKMIGKCGIHRPPTTGAEVEGWFTVHDIAKYGKPIDANGEVIPDFQVSVREVVERIKDHWGFADLVKPKGWERVVDAKRNGVLLPSGQRMPIRDFLKEFGISQCALINRLAKGWRAEDLTLPGYMPPTKVSAKEARLPHEPPTKPSSAAIYARSRFAYMGVVDTLSGHCRAHRVSVNTAKYRLSQGLPLEEVFDPARKRRCDAGRPNPRRGAGKGSVGVLEPQVLDYTPTVAEVLQLGRFDMFLYQGEIDTFVRHALKRGASPATARARLRMGVPTLEAAFAPSRTPAKHKAQYDWFASPARMQAKAAEALAAVSADTQLTN